VDPGLVRAAQGGDAGAIDDLIDALVPLVRSIAFRVAGAPAEDASQEALLVIFRDLHALRTPEAIISWASAVTARVVSRIDRGDRRHRETETALDADRPAAWFDTDAVEVAEVLRRLATHDHQLLVLRDLHGYSEREVADTLGVPLGTVKSRVHRARRRFREEWNR